MTLLHEVDWQTYKQKVLEELKKAYDYDYSCYAEANSRLQAAKNRLGITEPESEPKPEVRWWESTTYQFEGTAIKVLGWSPIAIQTRYGWKVMWSKGIETFNTLKEVIDYLEEGITGRGDKTWLYGNLKDPRFEWKEVKQ